MWAARFWGQRYWPTRYWPKNEGVAVPPCTYVPGPRNRFGIGRKFGTCKRFGDGFSDPWLYTGDDPVSDPFYSREIPNDVLSRHDLTRLSVDNRDELSVNYGGEPDEIFYLASPNGTVFRVTIDGDTGHIDVTDGSESIEFGEGANFQLALLNFGLPWQPSIPIDIDSIDTLAQWQLLHSIPFTGVVAEAISGTPVDKYIVDFDGDMFQLTVNNDGTLGFSDDFEVHTPPSDIATPVYTEE